MQHLALLILLVASTTAVAQTPHYEAELVFPLHNQHNHAPGIVVCPNGDLLVSWFRGSGERTADDVAVYGARKKQGEPEWCEPFVMADHKLFPDCNTCMIIDRQGRLMLFWPIILANTWESCLTNCKISTDYQGEGPPKWDSHQILFLKPDNFQVEALAILEAELGKLKNTLGRPLSEDEQKEISQIKQRLGDKLHQRLGWQPRCKPTILPSGRILLPLYSDTYSFGLMAISDDNAKTWFASKPLMGFGAIQPSVLRRNDGTLMAYMRENGVTGHVRTCESTDEGLTWGPVGMAELPNPGSGLDSLRLANGHWLIVYNDTTDGRNSLAVSLSEDEGKTWGVTRHLENESDGRYHYPAVTQGDDGSIHIVYTYSVKEGKSMKHVSTNEDWIREGDPK